MREIFWHNISAQQAVENLASDVDNGLSDQEAQERLVRFGENRLPQKGPQTAVSIFLAQFRNPFIYILIIVGIIILILEEYPQNLLESCFIFIAIMINVVFGFWEENKASKTFETLKKLLKTKTIVIRNGNKKEIFQEQIVPGDIVVLNSGNKVPADGRLIESENLEISEATLTGEWLPVLKTTRTLKGKIGLADRKNMVFAGCLVRQGQGKAVITSVGQETEAGKIAILVKKTKEEKTPLQKKIVHFSRTVSVFIGLAVLFIFFLGIIKGQDAIEMFEIAAAVTVGGIPESLPIVMTLILAIGMGKLSKKKGLIRKLSSVETFGSVSVICADKTRTLTKGDMEADKIVTIDKDFKIGAKVENSLYYLSLEISTLCNEAFIENPNDNPAEWKVRGRSTDRALLLAGKTAEVLKPRSDEEISIIKRVSFNSVLKYESVLLRKDKKFFLYFAGAPENILAMSSYVKLDKGRKKINAETRDELFKKLNKITKTGKRVIAVGFKQIKEKEAVTTQNLEDYSKDITFVSFVSLIDPLREGVKDAFRTARQAGLKSVIITGDHKQTALFVAKEIGIKIKDKNILEGWELDEMSEEELRNRVVEIKIYARAEPKHKMRVVQAWQDIGEVVAMTGDGVNDTPALRKADIGLALGSGTDVAKQTADLVLLDNSFDIIIKAIEQGRATLDNIRKAISYILADSLTSVILVGGSIILGWPIPILWTQILWNNIVEDALPSIAYAFEPNEKDIMKRGPNSNKSSLLTKEMKVLIFATGLIDEFLIFFMFWLIWGKLGLSLDYARTMVLGALCVDTAFVVYCYKDLKKNIWQIDVFNNRFLLFSSLIVFISFAAAIYFPPIQAVLHTVSLGIGSWAILIGLALISMFLIEITKWYFIVKDKNINK
jgi:P-type Ca2+ transporter type 2C